MDRERHLRIYDLHSWSGITLGLFVFIVCITGCFALFDHEIHTWEDPAKRLVVPEQRVEIHDTFASWVTANTRDDLEFARLDYPTSLSPFYMGMIGTHFDGEPVEFIEARWNASTGELLPERGAGLSEWILDFHRDLMWPEALGGRQVGRALVGVAGIILMLAIVTGIVIHTKLTQELFTLRFFRSVRLKWQDAHKVLGLWGLPFHAAIAVTGAYLGVVAILAPIVALLSFKGDQEALIEAVVGKPLEPAGIERPMYSLDEVGRMREPTSGFVPMRVILRNWGDQNARYDVFFDPDTELASIDAFELNGVTGEHIDGDQFEVISAPFRVGNAFAPIHYGTYGGISLKLLYFVLGLSLAIITALGLIMWLERRLHGNAGSKPPATYRRIGHIVTGVCLGFPLATAGIFTLDKLYWGAEAARLTATGNMYFALVALSILYAFLRRNDYKATRDLMGLTGLLFACLPALNFAKTGGGLPDVFGAGHTVAGYVDVGLLTLGVVMLWVSRRLPKQRSQNDSGRKRAEAQTEEEAQIRQPLAAE